jgi:RNA polymerase sigma factor (sigma-70 family)
MLDTDSDRTQRSVPDLVAAARAGDERAWTQIIERYGPLVGGIAHNYRLSAADVEDVKQSVWLKLVANIDRLRKAEALPGWLATTTANACLAVIKGSRRYVAVDPSSWEGLHTRMGWGADGEGDHQPADVNLERDEVRRLVRQGLGELSPAQQDLLLHVVADPPLSYAEIGDVLQMPVGSIGPTRARCLQKLRNTEAVREMEHSAARWAA